jgi:hypothetical protein
MARKGEIISARITDVQHAATSRAGNPTYRITADDGTTYLTETDGSVGYGARNFLPRWRDDYAPTPVVLWIGDRGRVTHIIRQATVAAETTEV